jgi:peptidoglycan/xylan/chitin deacetylase (PgdA/CDA1 family)
MMRRWIGGLRRTTRQPVPRSEGRIPILLYHRIAKLRSDPWALAVTPRRFAEHLEVLRQYARPIQLQQLSQALLYGDNLPDRSVVITFDDGYADNLHNGKPVLERYNVPATFFLASGLIGQGREFWWDELDRLLLQPGSLPQELNLSIGGSTYRWELGEGTHYSEETSQRYRRWRVWEEAPTSRHSLYYSLWELLGPLTEAERRRVLHELRVWASAEPAGRSSHLPLSLEEAVDLAEGGLVEVGAHTMTHPALSKRPPITQRGEILGSKVQLQELLNRPVTSFSYPHGSLSGETVGIVRESGFVCGCASHNDLVKRPADLFQLPRKHMQNWDGDRFAKRLLRWFDGRSNRGSAPTSEPKH